jgi:tetratricopeptide (TPR) repeat protein
MYDIYQSMMACTGVLMRGPHGSIIQGRLNDMAAFGEISRIAAIVRHRPNGLNSFVHMDLPLYLGVETGMNEKGLCSGGETLRIQKPDGHGFSHPFLIRMILEEAGSLEEIYPFFDRYHQVGADGVVWSDLRRARGAVVELTPTAWAKRELEGPILWDFNRFYDESLARQQYPSYNIIGANIDREVMASAFPKKSEYSLEDAVDFIRNQTGPDGTDYAWSGTKYAICNRLTTQMMIFDSASNGFYLAMGPTFASRRTIYHVFSDFTKQPELFMTSLPVHPLAEKAAEIENSALREEDKLEAMVVLAHNHSDDANAQFLVAYKAFRLSRPEVFSQYAEKALDEKPAEPEYRLFAGLAAYQKKDLDKAITLLESAAARNPEQELFRLTVLERAWAEKDARKASAYRAEKQALMDRHGVRVYFRKKLQPLLDSLENNK